MSFQTMNQPVTKKSDINLHNISEHLQITNNLLPSSTNSITRTIDARADKLAKIISFIIFYTINYIYKTAVLITLAYQ